MNLYNLMIQYAHIKAGVVPGNSAAASTTFFTTLKLNIGGHIYTLNEWENGFLRGNAKSLKSIVPPFSRKDPRCQFVVQNPDPRLHFGLNRGSRSSSVSYQFSAELLEEELTIAAANFCENIGNVKLDISRREIYLSEVFKWYRSDFADCEKKFLNMLAGYMKGLKKQALDRMIGDWNDSPISIFYLPCDWSCLGCVNARTFDPKAFQMEKKQGFRGLLRTTSRLSPRRAISLRTPVQISPKSVAATSVIMFHY
jgi:Protein of unknown function, DUF547